ncbi:MAG: HAD hydrolase-like protein [Verrucomicrobiota bacterium]|jgi:phosphoglycolate phosphatase
MSFVPSSLILDLDGTLIDSKPGILESFGTAVATVFPGQEFDLSTVVLGPPIQRMFQVSFPKASESEIEGLLRVFRGHYDREGSLHTRLYDGAWDVLTYCQRRGIALDIATNKPLHISTSILAHLKLDDYFRSILAADSVQPPFAGKAGIIRHLLKANELKAGETLYVGDSAEDAVAAAACGIRFVWAAYGYGKLAEEEARTAFGTIRKLGDLTGLLG